MLTNDGGIKIRSQHKHDTAIIQGVGMCMISPALQAALPDAQVTPTKNCLHVVLGVDVVSDHKQKRSAEPDNDESELCDNSLE